MPNKGFKSDFKFDGVFTEMGKHINDVSDTLNSAEGFNGVDVECAPGKLHVTLTDEVSAGATTGGTFDIEYIINLRLFEGQLQGEYVTVSFVDGVAQDEPDGSEWRDIIATTDCGA